MEMVWKFETARFLVKLEIELQENHRYDGDDESGETQAQLDCGELVAFNSRVSVKMDGITIAQEWLCDSVYRRDDIESFWKSHRDSDALNRNSSIMRNVRGNCVICHYFPGMIAGAIDEARAYFRNMPRVRAA